MRPPLVTVHLITAEPRDDKLHRIRGHDTDSAGWASYSQEEGSFTADPSRPPPVRPAWGPTARKRHCTETTLHETTLHGNDTAQQRILDGSGQLLLSVRFSP